MANPHRRNARNGFSNANQGLPIPWDARRLRRARSGGSAIKGFAVSLGLAFAAGVSIGLFQTLWGNRGDTTDIAQFAFRTTGRALNAPAEWVADTMVLPGQLAEILLSAVAYVVTPYQALAYAGGYSGSMIVRIVQTLIPSWTFHF